MSTISNEELFPLFDTFEYGLLLIMPHYNDTAQIDLAFERIVNFFFYSLVAIIAISIWGINVWALFLSASTFFIGFSFLFGSAASNYFEVRKNV